MTPAYEVHDGTGPFALLVHGVLASRSHWILNLDALSSACRPVVVELYGHGRSPTPDDPSSYSPLAYVDAFEDVRRAVGAEKWLVIGHSLGAALSLRYVLDKPEHVLAHVFMNSNSALADKRWSERVRLGVEQSARALEAGGREALERHPLYPGRGRRLPALAREALVADAADHSPAGVARTFLHTVPDSPVRDRIHENQVPTMLIVGTREEQFEPARRYAESTMPHLVEVVELDTGHAVNIEDAEGFNAAVRRFLGAQRDDQR